MNFELIILVQLIIITIIVFYFSKLIKRFHDYQTEFEKLRTEINKKKIAALDEARNKAIKIIDDANSKGLDIVQKASIFANATNSDFNSQLGNVTSMQVKAFEKTTADFIKLYGTVLSDLRSKNIEIFQNISKNIEISTLGEVKKFKNTIEQETISSQKMLKSKIEHEYFLAKKDIENYRQQELKMVDDNVYEILEKVSSLVLGKAIKVSEHEGLILEALETAKKEGIFNNGK